MKKELMDSAFSDIFFTETEIFCEKHGKQKTRIMSSGKIKEIASCPICRKEKQEIEEARREEISRREEEIFNQKRIEAALNASMIPLRFRNQSFDTFIAKTAGQKKEKGHCVDFANNFPEKLKLGSSMIFCGNTGTGKTLLACSIANHIIKNHAKTAVFMNVIDAVRKVKETFNKSSEITEREAISRFSKSDLLILDEVGVQFGSDTEKMILFEIINKRYENMKPTILISNLAPKLIENYIGERAWDRLKENGGRVCIFNWTSNRSNI